MARYVAFVTVSPEVISSLRSCPPQHMKAGDELKLATFAVGEQGEMFPCKLKIRDRKVPVAGEVYRLLADSEEAVAFVDGQTGTKCRSRDNLMLRLYPHDLGEVRNVKGELRFAAGPLGSEPIFSPIPPFSRKLNGTERTGVWWIAAPGVDYEVSWTEPSDRLLFSGNVLVQLGALPERQVTGALKIDIANRVSVYDRRADRLSSFARAEHIRRTVGEGREAHTFEFINLRDVSAGEVIQAGGPQRLLTAEGLKTLEEVSA